VTAGRAATEEVDRRIERDGLIEADESFSCDLKRRAIELDTIQIQLALPDIRIRREDPETQKPR
jgi:hypothetical protein